MKLQTEWQNDVYGSDFREGILKSMEQPAKPKYVPMLAQERRKSRLGRFFFRLRQVMWDYQDDLGLLGFIAFWFILGVLVWGLWALARTK